MTGENSLNGNPKLRLAYLVTHPIQYQAPLLRLIAAQSDIDLTVFFQSDLSVTGYHDPGFQRSVQWDVPLLEGYNHVFLPSIGRRDRIDRLRPLSYGIASRLRDGRFDALWVHGYARWANWVAILAAANAGIPVLVRDEAHDLSAPRSRLKAAIKRLAFRYLTRIGTRFLAIGSLNRAYYLANGIPADRIFMVPYCVDNDYFQDRAAAAAAGREALRARLGLSPGRPVVLFASKFQSRKRAGDLLDALALLRRRGTGAPAPYLLLIGDGEQRAELEARATTMADDVRFLGFRNQSELPAFFDLCDVFVLPSDSEPWGLVVNEVMNAGRPVIVSDRVGCGPDLVKSGINGHIHKLGDIGGLADALADVLGDSHRAAAMGRASATLIRGWSFQLDLEGLRACLDATRSARLEAV